eukprot:m.12648 g.12648  ORF g.12648 m.12648 type:complete len:328 (-) comp4702_c0_seq2:130-1113(-)
MSDFEGFEGIEKNLSIRFEPNTGVSLRSLSRSDLDDICTNAACAILSSMSNEYIDAYVLSESSLFVTENTILMKTCGTTALLRAVPLILQLGTSLGLTLSSVRYSRHEYILSSHLQEEMHQCFKKESQYLDNCLRNTNVGVGSIDHAGPYNVYIAASSKNTFVDTVFEVNMFKLCQKEMSLFWKCSDNKQHSLDSTDTRGIPGVKKLWPKGTTDGHLFDPCGYSINGIDGAFYWTMHIAPEDCCSYVSFETNAPSNMLKTMIDKLLSLMKPGVMDILYMEHSHDNLPVINNQDNKESYQFVHEDGINGVTDGGLEYNVARITKVDCQ